MQFDQMIMGFDLLVAIELSSFWNKPWLHLIFKLINKCSKSEMKNEADRDEKNEYNDEPNGGHLEIDDNTQGLIWSRTCSLFDQDKMHY